MKGLDIPGMPTSLVFLLLGLALCWAGKGDVTCKKGKLSKKVNVGEGDSFMFRTQAGRTYAPNTKCFAIYKRKSSCPELKFSCSKFDIYNKHPKCKGEEEIKAWSRCDNHWQNPEGLIPL